MKRKYCLLLLLTLVIGLLLSGTALADDTVLISAQPTTSDNPYRGTEYEQLYDKYNNEDNCDNWTDADWLTWDKMGMGYPYPVAGEINVTLNGEFLRFDDARPVLVSGRTMLPYRALFESMQADVAWDNATQTAVATFTDGNAVQITLDSKIMRVGVGDTQREISMDAAPYLDSKLGRAYVPVRYIAEAAGWQVEWDDYYRCVQLSNPQAVIDEIDSAFTNYNRLMKLQTTDFSQNGYDINIDGNARLTLYGDNTSYSATMRGVATAAIDKNAMQLNMALDSDLGFVADMLDLLDLLNQTYFYGDYTPDEDELAEQQKELELLKQELKHIDLNLIVDDAEGLTYVNTSLYPLIDDTEMLADNVWITAKNEDIFGSWSEMLALIDSYATDYSLGSLLVEYSYSYDEARQAAALLYPLLGDDFLTTSTSNGVTTYQNKQDLSSLQEYFSSLAGTTDGYDYTVDSISQQLGILSRQGGTLGFDLMFKEQNGVMINNDFTASLTARGAVPYTATLSARSTGTRSTLNFTLTGKYVGKLTAHFDATSVTRSSAVMPKLPADAALVALDDYAE